MDMVMDLGGEVQYAFVMLCVTELVLCVGIDIEHDKVMHDEEAEDEQ
jgi:hypothetical protein